MTERKRSWKKVEQGERYMFETWSPCYLKFQTMNCEKLKLRKVLKYQRFAPSGCKLTGIL